MIISTAGLQCSVSSLACLLNLHVASTQSVSTHALTAPHKTMKQLHIKFKWNDVHAGDIIKYGGNPQFNSL